MLGFVKRRQDKRALKWMGLKTSLKSHDIVVYPKVTILIPTRDRLDLLAECLASVLKLTTYPNFEIVILDNDSKELITKNYFASISDSRVSVIQSPGSFNFSKIMNQGVLATNGDLICVLNNDTVVLEGTWLTNMVSHLTEAEVGIVGALLTFRDDTLQHAGIALGYTGVAGHVFSGEYPGQGELQQGLTSSCFPVSAVTFACALTARVSWKALGGLDQTLKVGLNDVDYCLRLQNAGLMSVVCTRAQLRHYESESRKSMKSLGGFARASMDVSRFLRKHRGCLDADPYFHRSIKR